MRKTHTEPAKRARRSKNPAWIVPGHFHCVSHLIVDAFSPLAAKRALYAHTNSLAVYGGEALTAWNWCTSLRLLMIPSLSTDAPLIDQIRSRNLFGLFMMFWGGRVGVQFRAAHSRHCHPICIAGCRASRLVINIHLMRSDPRSAINVLSIRCEYMLGLITFLFFCLGFCINKTQRRPIPPAIISHLGF